MLEEVRGTARLRGWRGAPPADEAALRDVILRVSALIEACPEIREMDLNPVKRPGEGRGRRGRARPGRPAPAGRPLAPHRLLTAPPIDACRIIPGGEEQER